jgi:hypothetical protein|tara:strand:+ start:68 stop:523 length:456 start_codon:yes stop_codon:yes gene_type:complete
MAKKTKSDKIWAYKIRNRDATVSEIAKATKTSYGYVYKLMQKIGTPTAVLLKPVVTSESLEPRSYSRGDILDTAKEYVTKDRAADHGDMENNFNMIADYWSLHLEQHIDAHDVAVMMTLLKVARIKSNPKHMDNFIDGAGYLACGGELVSK